MSSFSSAPNTLMDLPDWVPTHARHYLAHTELGLSIRSVAREAGCAASTVLRQIRKLETERDDPLIDEALDTLRAHFTPSSPAEQDVIPMSAHPRMLLKTETAKIEREARRILRRLCESDAVLAVSPEMEKAVVLRMTDGIPRRIAVVDRGIAQAFALQDWVKCRSAGKVAQYEITHAGRLALKRLLADDAKRKSGLDTPEVAAFAEQHRDWGERQVVASDTGETARLRYNLAESPMLSLARRRDKDGTPFLTDEMVSAGERLREDFELAQMGPRTTQNWEKFLTTSDRSSFQPGSDHGGGSGQAKDRVHAALQELGPGLGDVVLRCCCFLEGLEAAEKRMGWSARSGKIVLRIALQRLSEYYKRVHGQGGGLIG
ncbi:conserved hypothetical protein [Dinoroseobacter shibae DFL 12 = DSM 16493]|uniref:DUF6456 domain-containing protein n=3 Tax=root TaxID=1 RepID=A8LKW2_DINSH|nr:DUF6456 domain-containing protein [Dinoroseobacter shibae]ABV93326.1 conserved hypothetical protein [Dinoroseobacter shibae DFL 12 = DSM 16493]URF48242.1 DUF6456 domain-containing protein [Dinoroseobacter shibae]URF52552.1 DUF6456 domain-containing protein [Dinoroseobacter shibae]DBA12219.1 TPA_asm: DUF6456 domain-containing protein [Dinogtaviriform tomaschi]